MSVTPLRPVEPTRFDPEPRLIEQLERMLEDARSGKMRALAWAEVHHDGNIPDGTSHTDWVCGRHTAFAMVYGAARLMHRLMLAEDDPTRRER